MRNPASGYVQGINDLVTPFFEVFLGAYISKSMWQVPFGCRILILIPLACDPELFDVTHLPSTVLAAIEADSFWCLSKLLDGIQDNYITAQPGIHRLVRRMTELVRRIDCRSDSQPEEGMSLMPLSHSSSSNASRRTRGRIHAIRIPVDELSADARNQRQVHDSHVGHLFSQSCGLSGDSLTPLTHLYTFTHSRPKAPTPFLNFTYTCVLHSW